MQYRVHFSRYKNHERRISAVEWIIAEDFADAFEQAEKVLRGMKLADPEAKFDITTIDVHGLGNQIECTVGWKSQEEFSAEVAAKNGNEAS